ncbi:hypothetical protein [Stomatobaculum longum]|uniref:hypothetical protein n=1 Tax=Stomatobaculum longum TaxID=796942 RepID=UPI002805FC46|nr:hypothetical protein [Stomatobaculum longum]
MQVNEPASDRTARETPHLYVRQEDRYEDLSSSASAFLIVGIVMSVLTLLSFGQQLHLPFALPTTALMRFFLLVFAIGAFGLYWKTRREASRAYSHIEEEQRITEELESWFLASYAPEQIDLEILGATRHPLRAEALALKRFDFIQDCFLQRYDGMDEGYIEALSEELYKKLFESGHYGKAVLKKVDAAVSEEQRSETAPQNAAPQDMAQASEEMQPVDAVQSAEIPETAAYSIEPQTMAPENKADAYNAAPPDTAQENEAAAYNAEPQTMEQAEAVPSEHEAETADSAETLSAVVSATEDAAAASAETEAAARDEAPVEQS